MRHIWKAAFLSALVLVPGCKHASMAEVRSAWMMCDFERTLSLINRLPRNIRSEPSTVLREARALSELQRFEPALRLLTSISETKEIDRHWIRQETASALAGLGRWQEALELIEEAAQDGGDPSLMEFWRAFVAYGRGDLDLAGTLLWESVRLDPDQAGAWFNLAVVLAEQDEQQLARWALGKSWKTGLRYPGGIRREAGFRSMIEAGMLDDMLSSRDAPLCDTWW